jgi:glutathione S-transferase
MAPIKVHGVPLSPPVQRVLACLYEKDLEFEFVSVSMMTGEHKSPAFVAMNPFGQVPAVEDGDIKLFESRAINNYISRRYADKGTQLIQESDPKKLALSSIWTEVEAQKYDPLASKVAFELAIKPVLGMVTDHAAAKESEEKLGKVLDVYEAHLAKSKYLAGDSFTLADLHHLPTINYIFGTPSKEVFTSRPHVSAWCSAILARPAWTKVAAMLKN